MSASSTKPKLSSSEVLDLIFTIIRTLSKTSITLVTALFRGAAGNKLYSKHVAYTALKTLNGRASARQIQAIAPSTEEAYTSFAKANKFEPIINEIPATAAKVVWLGDPEAANVLVCLHGGGFVYPASAQFQWFWDLRQQSRLGPGFAVALLAYSLAPGTQYPGQLAESVELLRYLTEEKGKKPEHIVIVGDSAGGQLGLGIASHLLHPHPSIAPLQLSAPLAGLALISPWVTPRTTAASVTRNASRDAVDKASLDKWGAYGLGSAAIDQYNAPVTASPPWWVGVEDVVNNIVVTGGRSEVIFDDIEMLVNNLKPSAPGMQVVFVDETHDQPLLDPIIGIREDCESSKAVKAWVDYVFRD